MNTCGLASVKRDLASFKRDKAGNEDNEYMYNLMKIIRMLCINIPNKNTAVVADADHLAVIGTEDDAVDLSGVPHAIYEVLRSVEAP